MAQTSRFSINLGLSNLPELPAGEQNAALQAMYPEITRIYNAIKALAFALDAYTGVSSSDPADMESLGASRVLTQNTARFYCIFDDTVVAGAAIHIINTAGVPHARLAKAADASRPARGISSGAVTSGEYGEVILLGYCAYFSGLTIGTMYYLSPTSTTGQLTATKPSTAGQIVQACGVALSATGIFFNPQEPIQL